MLKYKADIKTVIFLIAVASVFMFQWFFLESLNPVIYVIHLYLAIAVAVIAHNQNHVPMWKSSVMNHITDYWITAFYGFPTFAWIPTHNKNHHKYNNRDGDYTITYRLTEGNHLGSVSSYPLISGYFQQKPIKDFLAKAWKKKKLKFLFYISQYFIVLGIYAVGFWFDWQKALLYMVIPHQVSLNTVLVFNYVQHVHADELSKYNHSRNFVGRLNRMMLFNNGLHTVHHENANIHWSLLPERHKKLEDKIDPTLNERGFIPFMFKRYILGLFVKKYRTKSMRLERMSKEKQRDLQLTSVFQTSGDKKQIPKAIS